MLPFISIGPLALPSKPFIFILGIYACLWIVDLVLDQVDAEPEWVRATAFRAIIVGLIGGRLVFALTHLPATIANPASIIWPITIGYSLWGSILFGTLSLIFFSRQQNLSPLQLLDAFLQPILALLAASVLGDYLGGPGFGTTTSFPRLPTHPVQIYELLVVVAAFFLLRYLQPFKKFEGWLSLVLVAFLSAGFLFTFNFRGAGTTWGNGFQVNQIAAFAILIFALATLAYLAPNNQKESLTSN